MNNRKREFCSTLLFLWDIMWGISQGVSQPVYFADGQHGGVYGHYPAYVTQFLTDQLARHSDWRINLEIEPETWDVVQTNTPDAYSTFKKLFVDQSADGRIEYVDPQYGQSFLWNIPGECIIRQFDYGIQKVRKHFPTAKFTTYSAEEPMFTSALPGILKSFGFEYAVLKNPNTCWGGYTRAFGGELINWIGPDGTKITTVPRYAIESLQPGSTWQTIASEDSTNYIEAAFKAGIKHPIGMCYQDAGWRFGPWMDHVNQSAYVVIYETWRNYFETISTKTTKQDWHLSQEDILVSLVWGSQILQQIAQEVRNAENKIVAAETLAAMAKCYSGTPWPKSSLDEAWRTLLLSEHHDCWIVPYNLRAGSTWAQHVAEWTGSTRRTSDEVMQKSMSAVASVSEGEDQTFVRVFNNLGVVRRGAVSVPLPPGWSGSSVRILNEKSEEILSQVICVPNSEGSEVLLQADVPALGYNSYQLERAPASSASGANVLIQADGTYKIETDLYKIVLDPSKGGTIKSLVAKALENKEFVDSSNARKFDEIRGYFYSDGGFHSSADGPAEVNVLENGPLRVRVAIKGTINSQSFVKVISVTQGQKAIDLNLKIDWKGSPGIGAKYGQTEPFEATNKTKAFYDDRYKLLSLFPSNLSGQKVFKNAPFDVMESKLTNTFFTSWDGIKNNIILNWVDVTDASERYGLALLTDHTTSYTHGVDFPLGLTLQYSGTGLWGKNYRIAGPTEVHYALIPHAKKWDRGCIWTESDKWNQPLIAATIKSALKREDYQKSLIDVSGTGLEVPSVVFQGEDLIVRIFNAEGDATSKHILYHGKADSVQMVELNGRIVKTFQMQKDKFGDNVIEISLPRFGVRTIRFCNAHI